MIVNTPTKKKPSPLTTVRFSGADLQSENFGQNVCLISLRKVNFGTKYLGSHWEFVQHINTYLKCFLVIKNNIDLVRFVVFETDAKT
jgi:hypothetical protein